MRLCKARNSWRISDRSLPQVLVSGVYALADAGDCTPKAQTNPQDRDDDSDAVCVHGVNSTTLMFTNH